MPVGQGLVDVRNWTLVIGPSMAAFNALMFGTLLYRSRLVPRAIPALGIVGAPLLISWVIGTMLGFTGPGTAWHGIAVAPFFFWELAVGLWMTFKGFDRSSPIVAAAIAESAPDPIDELGDVAGCRLGRGHVQRDPDRRRHGVCSVHLVHGCDRTCSWTTVQIRS